MGLRSGLCADQSCSSKPNWENRFFIEQRGHHHVETGKGQTQTVDTKQEERCLCLFKRSFYAAALKGTPSVLEKNPGVWSLPDQATLAASSITHQNF